MQTKGPEKHINAIELNKLKTIEHNKIKGLPTLTQGQHTPKLANTSAC